MHRRSHHHRAAVLAAAVLGLACLGSAAPALATAPGLVDTTLPTPAANPLSSPTAIVPIGQTGRALVLEKDGAVRVLRADGTMLAADALTLGVCTGSEQGLLGAAVDPGFAANGFVYLYYSRDAGDCASSTGRFNRVSRFTMTGDTINAASEVVLLDDMNSPAGNHNGGDLDIGHDGDLYVTVGDGGVNPRGGGPSAAQDLSLLNGKVLRITTTGGVPAGNPFAGAPGAASCRTAGLSASLSTKCTEIYGYGLRNPFRFAFDPNTAGAATNRLRRGLELAEESGCTSSAGPVQAWMKGIGETERRGVELAPLLETAADSIANALRGFRPKHLRWFGIEFLNKRENRDLTTGDVGLQLVRMVNKRVGGQGLPAKLLIDTAHIAESHTDRDEVLSWLKPAFAEGLIADGHISAVKTRGSLLAPAPWGELGWQWQVSQWKRLGFGKCGAAVEIFPWENDVLRNALELPETYAQGGILGAFAGSIALVQEVWDNA